MITPAFLARVGVGLAATAVDQVVAVPARTMDAAAELSALPVRVAGQAVRWYLDAGRRVTELAIRGDRVIEQVLPRRDEIPQWATFDEDVTDEDVADDESADDDAASATPPVATGRVSGPRR